MKYDAAKAFSKYKLREIHAMTITWFPKRGEVHSIGIGDWHCYTSTYANIGKWPAWTGSGVKKYDLR